MRGEKGEKKNNRKQKKTWIGCIKWFACWVAIADPWDKAKVQFLSVH